MQPRALAFRMAHSGRAPQRSARLEAARRRPRRSLHSGSTHHAATRSFSRCEDAGHPQLPAGPGRRRARRSWAAMWRTGHRHGRVVRRVKKCALLFARVGAGERLPSERLVQTAHHGGDLLEGCTDPLIVIRLEEVALVAALRVEPIGEHLRIGAEGGPHRVLGLPAADDLRVDDHQIEVLPRARARARVSRGQGHITKVASAPSSSHCYSLWSLMQWLNCYRTALRAGLWLPYCGDTC